MLVGVKVENIIETESGAGKEELKNKNLESKIGPWKEKVMREQFLRNMDEENNGRQIDNIEIWR